MSSFIKTYASRLKRAATKPIQVLVVDDEEAVRTFVERVPGLPEHAIDECADRLLIVDDENLDRFGGGSFQTGRVGFDER